MLHRHLILGLAIGLLLERHEGVFSADIDRSCRHLEIVVRLTLHCVNSRLGQSTFNLTFVSRALVCVIQIRQCVLVDSQLLHSFLVLTVVVVVGIFDGAAINRPYYVWLE